MTDTATNHVESMPGGVSFAAVLLSLLTGLGAICLIGSTSVLFITRNPVVPSIPTVRILVASFDLLLLLFLACCAWTVVGLFRLRAWARHSILMIGAADFLFFTLLCVLMLLARHNPIVAAMSAHPGSGTSFPAATILLGLAVFYGLLALIGAWWLVYFNLEPVKLAFKAANAGPSRV
jgi:hypothetical protein